MPNNQINSQNLYFPQHCCGKIFFRLLGIFYLLINFSCNEKVETNEVSPSQQVNEIAIVMHDSLWNFASCDCIRDHLAQTIYPSVIDEPLFNIVQYDPSIVSDRILKLRNLLVFEESDKREFEYIKNKNAQGQNYFRIKANDYEQMMEVFTEYEDSITQTIRATEREIVKKDIYDKGWLKSTKIKNTFHLDVKIPLSYRLIQNIDNNFVWYQRLLYPGDANLVIYEVPFPEMNINDIDNILFVRDNVMKHYLKGTKPDSHIETDYLRSQVATLENIKGVTALKIVGAWRTKNDFMTGPFVSYILIDEYFERYIFIEGIINNTFRKKRELLIEMDVIINSVKFL